MVTLLQIISHDLLTIFAGLALSDEDYEGIRQLLLQLFTENDKTIDVSALSKALIDQNIVGTILKQVQVCRCQRKAFITALPNDLAEVVRLFASVQNNRLLKQTTSTNSM